MSTPARASIRQVAERAGVSPMTVSNVMRGRNGIVAPETMERVLAAVRELGYAPVPQPTRQGRRVETRTIGLVFDLIEVEDIWGAPTYRGMRAAAKQLDYDLLTLLRERPDWMLDQTELQFLDRRSDGFIFAVPKERERVLETLVKHSIPVVSCFIDDVPTGVAAIVLDNADAMRQAVNHVFHLGHREIVHIAGLEARTDFRHRRQGFEAAIRAAGLEPRVLQWKAMRDVSWLAELKPLLERKSVTAVICTDDSSAVHVLRLAQSMGLSVPQDLSIVGMDNQPEAANVGLTSIGFSCEEVGQKAVRAVVRMIEGEAPESCNCVVPVQLVERSSVAPPKPKGISR